MSESADIVMAVLDRSLTDPVRARGIAGRWAPATAAMYVQEWGLAQEWWARERRAARAVSPVEVPDDVAASPMPWPPDRLARYVAFLAEQGRAPATIRKIISAVKALHRVHGQPVPDGVPALAVLQAHDVTLRCGGWSPKRAEVLALDEALRILASVDRGTVRGRRDACLLMITYGGMCTAGQLAGMRLRDVQPAEEGVLLHRQAGDDWLLVPHMLVDGVHHPQVCAVEAVLTWWGWLRDAGADGWSPLMRPVDQHGRVGGLDPLFSGRIDPAGRVTGDALGTILAAIMRRADVAGRYTMLSLRLGGVVRLRLDGATVDELTARSGMSAVRSNMVDYIRQAEQWAIASTRPADTPRTGHGR